MDTINQITIECNGKTRTFFNLTRKEIIDKIDEVRKEELIETFTVKQADGQSIQSTDILYGETVPTHLYIERFNKAGLF